MGLLLLLFVVVPAVELALLIEVGGRIGAGNTLLLILATGFLGAALARSQGLRLLQRIQSETSAGRVPGRELMEGAMVLVAGAVLITPGFLTDILGVLCLLPPTRRLLMVGLAAWLRRSAAAGHLQVKTFGGPSGAPGGPAHGRGGARPPPGAGPAGPIKDVEFEVREDAERRRLP